MKTTLKTASTATARFFKRQLAWYKMRAIEINLADACNTLEYISDADTHALAQANIRILSRELCRARADYQAMLPPGQRLVFDHA